MARNVERSGGEDGCIYVWWKMLNDILLKNGLHVWWNCQKKIYKEWCICVVKKAENVANYVFMYGEKGCLCFLKSGEDWRKSECV